MAKKKAPRDNEKLTAKAIKYEQRGTFKKQVEVTVRAGDQPLFVSGPNGYETFPAWTVEVFTFWCRDDYTVTAHEGDRLVDTESSRMKQGLTKDTKLDGAKLK